MSSTPQLRSSDFAEERREDASPSPSPLLQGCSPVSPGGDKTHVFSDFHII